MFFTPEMMDRNPFTPRNNDRSFIRVLHAIPNVPAVDVYANGMPIARNLTYRDFTEYQGVPAGVYNIEVFIVGRMDVPVIRATINLPDRSIFTIAAVGLLPNISLLPILEPKMIIPPGMTMIRFSHLSPTTPAVDLTLSSGIALFTNVRFKETTSYIPIPPATYRLQIKIAGTNQVLLDVPNIRLSANNYYSVYAIGLLGGQPPLQVLIPLDGPSYINP